ncbi:MAG: HAMP domain-containing sensor histidine kinase [bacterium]|nr:HAMP domain-containing sensor histidine kinase [bacterium]
MNKTAFRIGLIFTLTAAVISTFLLVLNFIGFAAVSSDTTRINESPERLLNQISANLHYENQTCTLNEEVVIPDEDWCILINEQGNIIWSVNQPSDIPTHYTLNDVANMTKWFLKDYPVYVCAKEYGLLVLGVPKNSVGKYNIEYSMSWFETLPQRILTVLVINLILASIFAALLGTRLFKRLREFMNGVRDLRLEKPVSLREKGLFKELSKSINETSAAIERKNAVLARKDHARLNWIAGISHDIRTPLSIIMGNAEALECEESLSDEGHTRTGAILTQSTRIKKLVEDLNLISSLEYDMQPAKKSTVHLCAMLRRIVTDTINSGLSDRYEILPELKDEKMTVLADEPLLERAIYNLLHNSIAHNPDGCKIEITAYAASGQAVIVIRDNGVGVPDEVLGSIKEMPQTAHGLGLPMAYKIILVHGGKMIVKNEHGFVVQMELPLEL